jgi:hypothetical protein
MAETPSLATLTRQITAGADDRAALLDTIAAQVDDPRLAHLLRKARNLTGSPHFDEAFADFTAAAEGGEPATAAASAGGASRAELYERAKQAQVPGRSTMTKQELADALEETA